MAIGKSNTKSSTKSNTKSSTKSNENMVYFSFNKTGATIENVRQVSDTFISFTIRAEGFSLYNMQYRETQDGKRFICPPSTKASNGKYYPQYAVYLSEEQQDQIIAEIEARLKNDTEK